MTYKTTAKLFKLLKAYAKQPVHALLTGAVVSVISFALDGYDYLYEFIPLLVVLGIGSAILAAFIAFRYVSKVEINNEDDEKKVLATGLQIPFVYYSLIFCLLTLVMGGMSLKFGAPDQKIDAISGKIDNLDSKMQAALEKSGIDENPNSREAIYRSALKLYEGGEYPEAKKKIEEYLSGGSKFIDPYYLYKDILISIYGLEKTSEILSNMADTVGDVGFEYISATTAAKDEMPNLIEAIQKKYPDFPMTYFDLAKQNGWEKIGKPRTYTQKHAEYMNVVKFKHMLDNGEVRRWFISPKRFDDIKTEFEDIYDTVFNSGSKLAEDESKLIWLDDTYNFSGTCQLTLAIIENPQNCKIEYSVAGDVFKEASTWIYGCDKDPNDYQATVQLKASNWHPSERKDVTVRYRSTDGIHRTATVKDIKCGN